MTPIVEFGLSNALVAFGLAALAMLLGLFRPRPAVVHALWLLVLLKLVTPPLLRVPVTLPEPPVVESAAAEEPIEAEDDVVRLRLPEERIVAADLAPLEVERAEAVPVPASTWLVGLWLAGAAAWFSVAAYRLTRFARLLRLGRPAPASLAKRVARLAHRVGLASSPRVVVLPGRLAPMVWGFGRPLLLLPEGLEEQVGLDGLDTLLLHELSHIKRGDHLVRWLEFVVLGLYWWLPVAWYARRELREAEEQCCDAWVVRTMPGAKRLYATALVEALDFLSQPTAAMPPLASALGPVADLKRRLTLIMRGTTPHLLGRPAALAVFGLAMLLLPLVPGLSQARQEPKREDGRADEEMRKLQEELRHKKMELEQLARRMEQVARDKAKGARKMAEEMRERAVRDVEVWTRKQREGEAKKGGTSILIEVDASVKSEQVKEILAALKKSMPEGKVNIKVTQGGDADWGRYRVAPKAPKPPAPPRPADAAPKPGGGEGDRRFESLERRLEGVMRDLESLRRDMQRGPGGRGEGAKKDAPKPKSREREREREEERRPK